MSPERAEPLRRRLDKADHDRSAAQRLFTPGCLELDVIAFHCQQAVEKLLKAYLTDRARPFQKTHDLGLLLDYCAKVTPAFEHIRPLVEPLTVYAVAFRYPGPAEPTRDDVATALDSVERVREFVVSHLPG